MGTRREFVAGMLVAAAARAQQMAHPGWRGNGIRNRSWATDTDFVRFTTSDPLPQIAASLDSVVKLGAGAILLPEMQPDSAGDDFDTLLREASAHRLHVVLSLPVAGRTDAASLVRLWLSRGIGGLDLGDLSHVPPQILRDLRGLADHVPGSRILLAELFGTAPPLQSPIQLWIGSGSLSRADVLTELPGITAPELATILRAGNRFVLPSALLAAPADTQDLVARLLALRTTRNLKTARWTRLETGSPGLTADLCIARQSPALMLLANASGDRRSTQLHAKTLAHGVRGTFLRALLRTDNALGSLNLDEITLPAGTIFFGEVRS